MATFLAAKITQQASLHARRFGITSRTPSTKATVAMGDMCDANLLHPPALWRVF